MRGRLQHFVFISLLNICTEKQVIANKTEEKECNLNDRRASGNHEIEIIYNSFLINTSNNIIW